MTISADALVDEACSQTGLGDFGGDYYREGLDRLVDAINTEADLNETGELIQHASLVNLLAFRLSVEETYREHSAIEDSQIGGPIFVIGLPRTGTTALSQLVAADPQFRSLRTWESSAPTPPPETATEHTDPRIAQTAENLAMMDAAFPLMKTMHHAEPEAPTECQDLMGMSFRTMHFDGMLRVPTYLSWVLDCDMDGTYAYHRRVLKLLQWHCPPNLWHLKTPVHIFALDSLVKAYPEAKFLWSHRDPAAVLGSVCSLIAYVRSWSSDRTDPIELGPEMVACWSEGIRRAMDFRARHGDDRFVDVPFANLQHSPVETLRRCYSELGLEFSPGSLAAVSAWAQEHRPGSHGEHSYDLADYGLTADGVREHFAAYLERYDASA